MCSCQDTATILHADLDAFFASVEQRDDPALRGKPVLVGGGVVMAASYEAKARGITQTAMGGRGRRQLCPRTRSSFRRASPPAPAASKAVYAVFDDTTPLVEGLIDRRPAFRPAVRGMERMAGTPARRSRSRLRRDVLDRVGLPITVGVARTKFLAKVASGVAKPDGLLVVPPEEELHFLHALPVERLWGVGPVTAGRLQALGIVTVGEVAELGEGVLVSIVGRAAGRQLHALAHNLDPRRVQARARGDSIGAQRALGRGRTPPRRSTRRSSRSSIASRAGCAQPASHRANGRAAVAVRRFHARDALAHARVPDGALGADPGHGAVRSSPRRR